MQQIKIFSGEEDGTAGLEKDINAWLRESGVKVVNIFGNIAPQTGTAEARPGRRFAASDVMIAVLYEKA
jgi:hypothetical protein